MSASEFISYNNSIYNTRHIVNIETYIDEDGDHVVVFHYAKDSKVVYLGEEKQAKAIFNWLKTILESSDFM